jgi:hypothetical protein
VKKGIVVLETSHGRCIVVRGWLWRRTNPHLKTIGYGSKGADVGSARGEVSAGLKPNAEEIQ